MERNPFLAKPFYSVIAHQENIFVDRTGCLCRVSEGWAAL